MPSATARSQLNNEICKVTSAFEHTFTPHMNADVTHYSIVCAAQKLSLDNYSLLSRVCSLSSLYKAGDGRGVGGGSSVEDQAFQNIPIFPIFNTGFIKVY